MAIIPIPQGASTDVSFYLKIRNQYDGDPRDAFVKELQSQGFELPAGLVVGKFQNIKAPNQKRQNDKKGWYIYEEIDDSHNDGGVFGVATYGSFIGEPEKATFCSKKTESMTPAERQAHNAIMEAAKAKREQELLAVQQEAAKQAFELWNQMSEAKEHGYLAKKGVSAFAGVRVSNDPDHFNGWLVVPVCDESGFTSLQFISANGDKYFLPTGKTKGGFFIINPESRGRVYIAEGYATGASIAEATGACVYVAFNCGNLYDVASIVKKRHAGEVIVIAGDDDRFTAGNAGRSKAMQAAQALGLDVVFPVFQSESEGVDFNDLHQAEGIEAVQNQLTIKRKVYKQKKHDEAELQETPTGFLSDMVSYYNATSGNAQPLFAQSTAIALASVICSRHFSTNLSNRSALFLLNIGKTGTGKEHSKKVIERVLGACGMDNLLSGAGYTSGAGVFSALISKPRHIAIVDEFSKALQAAQNRFSNSHQMEANTMLMQAFGRLDGTMYPKAYATMGMKESVKKEIESMKVVNPSITFLGIATPDDLFKTLDVGAIKDGFLNRFIICISNAERTMREHKEPLEVPESIIKWVKQINERIGTAAQTPHECNIIHTLNFEIAALDVQRKFQQYCIDRANEWEVNGLAEMTGRSNEQAMRLALIAALARNPQAESINAADMQWAVEFVKAQLIALVQKIKMSISNSEFESWKKSTLQALRDAGEAGVTWSAMQKRPPFSQYKQKDLKEILQALKDADLIFEESHQPSRGRPTILYRAGE